MIKVGCCIDNTDIITMIKVIGDHTYSIDIYGYIDNGTFDRTLIVQRTIMIL